MKKWRTILRNLLLLGISSLCLLVNVFAQGEPREIPALTGVIVDETKWLTSQEILDLEKSIKALKKEGRVQVAVLIVNSTKPEAIEQFSIRVAEKWKIGQKGIDNGVLITIARDIHRSRIDVGYGLEGVIPDLVAKKIITESLSPSVRRDKPYDGISKTLLHIKKVTESEAVLHGEHPKKNNHEDVSEIPFFDELSSGGKTVSVILGIIGGICLLIGIHGESFEAALLGIGIPSIGGLILGLIFFIAQFFLVMVVSVIIAVMIGLGISVGGALVSGGAFGGGGASD